MYFRKIFYNFTKKTHFLLSTYLDQTNICKNIEMTSAKFVTRYIMSDPKKILPRRVVGQA